jgi:nucleoside-diphosphate-sugar epimerase
MNRSILVTGASGFVGRRLAEALRQRGHNVLTHSSRDGDLAHTEPRAAGVYHVYHLAARSYVPESWKEPLTFYETNVLGTVNVLEFCRKTGASLTLLSSYMYGKPESLPISEHHPLRPFNPYSHSKLLAEEVAGFYRKTFVVPVTIVRPFNPYGPWQSRKFLIPTLILQALSPEFDSITVADDRPKRDYIFIDDLVDLLLRLLDCSRTNAVYNAGSGVSISVRELGESVARLAGTRKPVVSQYESIPDEVMDTVADIGRASRELNWFPTTSLEDGLKRTIAHISESLPSVASLKHERPV